ncbi:MAG TPA: dolichyl-phosphate beta-glucosyltransferase [Tepidisphaeraceae bacterium]|nr:dolichyl-phosphate beta-glucosyltransferase [Tepidisphaeraceae bacterium]
MTATPQPHLSLIVPAYNEVRRIAATLESMRSFLDSRKMSWEIIVSADGEDGTREAAAAWGKDEARLRIIGSPQRLGKGRGIREGVNRAAGQIIGFVDADYKTPIEEIEKILPALSGGYDLAIGSRKVGDSRIEVSQPLYRRAGSAAFHFVMGTLLGLRDIRDTQCGFKFFQREAAKTIFGIQRIDGYMFDVEILRLARLIGYRIKEVGVRWRDDGDSRYAPISGTIKNARELLRIRMMRYPELPSRER